MNELTAIKSELQRLRRGHRRCQTGLLLLVVAAGVCAILVIGVTSDLLLRLPSTICWLIWTVLVAAVLAAGFGGARQWRRRISDAAMAVLVEGLVPDAENRLVNAVQLTADRPAAKPVVEAFLAERMLDINGLKARQLSPARPFKWAAGILLTSLLLLFSLSLFHPAGTRRATLRLMMPMAGLPPYTLTQILAVTPGHETLLRGQNLEVEVQLAGIIPRQPRLIWDQKQDANTSIPMEPQTSASQIPPANHTFTARLATVFHDSRYRVVAGDARSPWFQVRVTSPPGLLSWQAHVIPPQYVDRQEYTIVRNSEVMDIPAGAQVTLSGVATADLQQVAIEQDGRPLATVALNTRNRFAIPFNIGNGGRLQLRLTAASGLESTELLPFVLVMDQAPTISIIEPREHVNAVVNSRIPVSFEARDDYGISQVGIERILPESGPEPVTAVPVNDATTQFNGRFIIDLPTFEVREGDTLRFRLWAEDNAPGNLRRRAYSAMLAIRIPVPEEDKKAAATTANLLKNSILDVIRLQRDNLRTTRALAELAEVGRAIQPNTLRTVQATQVKIRELAVELLANPVELGDLRNRLANLIENEMLAVLDKLELAHRSQGRDLAKAMQESVQLENVILAALTGLPQQLDQEKEHQRKVDLLTRLQRLTADQNSNLRASKQAQDEKNAPAQAQQLARVQDRLANDLIAFTDQCWVVMEKDQDQELRKRVRQVYDMFDEQNLYEGMLTASESLEFTDFPGAMQAQESALKTLLKGLDIMNRWRTENARKRLADAQKTIAEVGRKLAEMEKQQAKIAEVTRDLARHNEVNDQVREKLGAMDREQEAMADLAEKLAQDLYQFPELPVCNELNSKMREIYEEVEQAADSENAPAIEIAVQKEDSLLDAIRKAKERVEDIEMWLPDVPDNIAWNMESFDADEFPNMPLVPLPDELEDIVGELLEQAAEIDEQAQDATGNNMMADAEMGWGIMDGPMPNFSAKGKSGNTRPNDNEMTGRSGAGREGQSSGELVENHVKGLEGRETHARRTADQFQKGMVTEDENSTMKARATGGGKLGGESEAQGMFGNAPRRDLHMTEQAAQAQALRQETEALYATARLLYLGTGSLGAAAAQMKNAEAKIHNMNEFGALHRKVMRQLKESQVEIANDVVLPMPVSSVSTTGGMAAKDVDISQINEKYRTLVSDYYKGLENTK